MPKHSHKEKSTVNSIIDAAFELMETKPLDKITITEIAAKADVSRISFYRHFDTKEDIIARVLNNECDYFLELYPQGINNQDELFEILLKILHELYKDQEYIKVLYNSKLLYLWLNSFNQLFIRLSLTTAQAYFMSGGIYNILNLWIQQGFEWNPDEFVNVLFDKDSK